LDSGDQEVSLKGGRVEELLLVALVLKSDSIMDEEEDRRNCRNSAHFQTVNCRSALILVDVENLKAEEGSEAEVGTAQVPVGLVTVSTRRQ